MDRAPRGPMRLGDVLDETIRLYRQQALVYIGVMALTFVPLTVLLTLTGAGLTISALTNPEQLRSLQFVGGAGVVLIVFGLLYFLAFLLSQGASTALASGGFLARPMALLPAFRAGARHLMGLVAVSFLLGALVTAAALADLAIIVLLLVLNPLVGFVVLLARIPISGVAMVSYYTVEGMQRPPVRHFAVLAMPFGGAVYCGVRWALCFQTLMLEGRGARASLQRSWELVDGYWWRTLGFLILLGILVALLQYVPGLLLGIPLGVFEALTQPQAIQSGLPITSLVANLGSVFGWIIFGAVQWLAATVYYYDLRIRKEAFDLELRAQRLKAQ